MCTAFAEFWSRPPIAKVDLALQYRSGVVTKLAGCMMKICMALKKGTDKIEVSRSKLRAEVGECERRFEKHIATEVEWTKELPIALAKLADGIISLKKGLRG